MKHPLAIIWILLPLFFFQCIPPQEEDPGEINVSFSDKQLKHVIELADQHVIDSLLVFLKSESPTIRFYALKGFAQMKDSTVIDQVAVLLDDPIEQIQSLAAYTIGLTGTKAGVKYLMQAFTSSDTISARRPPNEWVLEALGRCGDKSILKNLATVTTYLPTDTAIVNGRSKAIYRFSLRKMILPEGTKLMLQVAIDHSFPPEARLYAGAYLARTKGIEFDVNDSHKLLKAFTSGSDQEKMFFAQALKKTIDSTSLILLKNKLSIEKHPGVKVNILNAISDMPYIRVSEIFFDALRSKSPEVSTMARNWIVEHGIREDAFEYYKMAKDTSFSKQSKVALLHASLKYIYRLDTNELRLINRTLRSVYIQNKDPYLQAAVMHGLVEYPWNFRFIRDEAKSTSYKVVQVAGIEALDELLRSENYIKSIGSYRKGLKKELVQFFIQMVESGDVGNRAAAGIALRNDDPEFMKYAQDTIIIRRLEMELAGTPKDIESHNELLKTISILKGTEYSPIGPSFNHPIDWFPLEDYKDDSEIVIATTKGDIGVKLFVKDSPATVSNFIKEAKRKYYNNKAFHRVVPNFVIQGGCPRGDGYGSLDYTIRSEFFPYNYDDEGYLGMASVGNHTEGVQFFITHSAIPHLDGNYTIFGKVTSGMDVVHRIGVGDQILTVSFVKK